MAFRTERGDARARLVAVERADVPAAGAAEVRAAAPHAARGLARWLDALAVAPPGRFAYAVPAADGDGTDHLTVVADVLP